MTLRKFAFLATMICGTIVLTGALHYPDLLQEFTPAIPGVRNTSPLGFLQFTSKAPSPQDHFVPGSITLPQGWESPQLQPTEFLDSVLVNFHPAKFTWLDVTLWQRSRDEESTFTAEGRLRTGPNGKVRLEWKILRREPNRVLVVSDGQGICRTIDAGDEPVQVSKADLPATEPRRGKVLENFGCTGFHALLADLRHRGRNWKKATGHCRGTSVIRLSATLEPAANSSTPRERASAADIYLDAANLWPLRIEWSQGDQVSLEMEFRTPRINSAPPDDELAQLFTISER